MDIFLALERAEAEAGRSPCGGSSACLTPVVASAGLLMYGMRQTSMPASAAW